VCGTFLDASKAFDKVLHGGLLKKLPKRSATVSHSPLSYIVDERRLIILAKNAN